MSHNAHFIPSTCENTRSYFPKTAEAIEGSVRLDGVVRNAIVGIEARAPSAFAEFVARIFPSLRVLVTLGGLEEHRNLNAKLRELERSLLEVRDAPKERADSNLNKALDTLESAIDKAIFSRIDDFLLQIVEGSLIQAWGDGRLDSLETREAFFGEVRNSYAPPKLLKSFPSTKLPRDAGILEKSNEGHATPCLKRVEGFIRNIDFESRLSGRAIATHLDLEYKEVLDALRVLERRGLAINTGNRRSSAWHGKR